MTDQDETVRLARHRFTPAVSVALALVWVLLWPGFASASIIVSNAMEGVVGESVVGPQIFSYHEGTEAAFDTSFDFDQGTYIDTELDATNEFLQLSLPEGVWWDLDWGARRCFDVTNPDVTLTEHQVKIVFDSSADDAAGMLLPNGADYRAVAEDDVTGLDFWVEGGVGTTETTIWVQLDLLGFNDTRVCVYFDNPDLDPAADPVSSADAVFSYDTPRQLYYPLSFRYNGSAGPRGSLDVVSFVDDNVVNIDGDIQTMAAGQVRRFTNVSPGSVILTTGPIAGRGIVDGMDSIAPVSFAGTDSVFPTNRLTQRWTMVSPSGISADVEIYNGTQLAWSGTVGGTVVSVVADVGNNRAGSVRSTNDVPILVNHTSSQARDAVLLPPYLGDDLYGVRSRQMLVGVMDAPGDFDIFRSDGSFTAVTGLAPGAIYLENAGADRDGDGTAIRIANMNRPTGALQQADADGWESTSFLPESLLENEYYLPTSAQYVAFSCPASTTINVGVEQVPCAPLVGDSPGHGVSGAAPAGTRIWSDNGANFYAYYEDAANNDETNLFGMKVARSYTDAELVITDGALELAPADGFTGTWTSPAFDTSGTGSNVFGLLSLIADVPADTEVRMQVARGDTEALALIAPFMGPDGTAATTFGGGENRAPYAWDFADQWFIVRVELSTMDAQATPLVDRVTLGYDLPEQGTTSFHLVATNGSTPDRDYVLRVWTEDASLTGSTATMTHLQSMGLTAASAAVVGIEEVPQIVINEGLVTQQTGADVDVGPGLPASVLIDTSAMIGADLTAVWQTRLVGSGIIVQHQLAVAFA